jgi:hypothetical protein
MIARVEYLDIVARSRAALDALDGLRKDPRVSRPNGLNVSGLDDDGAHVAVTTTTKTKIPGLACVPGTLASQKG